MLQEPSLEKIWLKSQINWQEGKVFLMFWLYKYWEPIDIESEMCKLWGKCIVWPSYTSCEFLKLHILHGICRLTTRSVVLPGHCSDEGKRLPGASDETPPWKSQSSSHTKSRCSGKAATPIPWAVQTSDREIHVLQRFRHLALIRLF